MKKRVQAPRSRSVSRPRTYKKAKKNVIQNVSLKSITRRPLSNNISTTLHYFDTFQLNPGAIGATATQVFRLSSIHDPDLTGVGHQPLGHDQLSQLFERYQVYKVDYHIHFLSRDTSINIVGYRISDSPNTSIDDRQVIENGDVEWSGLSPQGGSCDAKVMTGSVWLNDVHGITYRQYMANDDYGATFGSNPSEEGFLHVWCDGVDGDTTGCSAFVHLQFHVKLMGSTLTSIS